MFLILISIQFMVTVLTAVSEVIVIKIEASLLVYLEQIYKSFFGLKLFFATCNSHIEMRMADIRRPDESNENLRENVPSKQKNITSYQAKTREPITDIRSKLDDCCIKRRETIDVFRQAADGIQSLVHQPKRNASEKVIVLGALLSVLLSRYTQDKQIIDTSLHCSALAAALSLLYSVRLIFRKSTQKYTEFLELVINSTSSALVGVHVFTLLLLVLTKLGAEDLVRWAEDFTGFPSEVIAYSMAFVCTILGIISTEYSREPSEYELLMNFCSSSEVNEHEGKLSCDKISCDALKSVILRAEKEQEAFFKNWQLPRECARKIQGAVELGAEDFHRMVSLCKTAGRDGAKNCICQRALRLVLPATHLIPFELAKFISERNALGKTNIEVVKELRNLAIELERQLKLALMFGDNLVYYRADEITASWDYIPVPPKFITNLDQTLANRNVGYNEAMNQLLKDLIEGTEEEITKVVNDANEQGQKVETIGY